MTGPDNPAPDTAPATAPRRWLSMWGDEAERPGLAAFLYALAMLLGLLSAHAQAMGWW